MLHLHQATGPRETEDPTTLNYCTKLSVPSLYPFYLRVPTPFAPDLASYSTWVCQSVGKSYL